MRKLSFNEDLLNVGQDDGGAEDWKISDDTISSWAQSLRCPFRRRGKIRLMILRKNKTKMFITEMVSEIQTLQNTWSDPGGSQRNTWAHNKRDDRYNNMYIQSYAFHKKYKRIWLLNYDIVIIK